MRGGGRRDQDRGGRDGTKPIRFSVHTLGYVERRGFTAQEVEEIIRTYAWQPAERGKLECRQDYPFNAE